MRIEIDKTDLFLLLGSSLRYCYGRRSYIVGSCGNWLVEYAPKCDRTDHGKLIEELGLLLREEDSGDKMDGVKWISTLTKLKASYEDKS